MVNDNIEIVAKLKLDTTEAESKLAKMSKKKVQALRFHFRKTRNLSFLAPRKSLLNNLFKGEAGLHDEAKLLRSCKRC